jgi:hypothetical protein
VSLLQEDDDDDDSDMVMRISVIKMATPEDEVTMKMILCVDQRSNSSRNGVTDSSSIVKDDDDENKSHSRMTKGINNDTKCGLTIPAGRPPRPPPSRQRHDLGLDNVSTPSTTTCTATTKCNTATTSITHLDDEFQLYTNELQRYKKLLQEKLQVLQEESRPIDMDVHRMMQWNELNTLSEKVLSSPPAMTRG